MFILFFGQEACRILAPQPGIKPACPEMEGKVLTAGLPGKSPDIFWYWIIKVNNNNVSCFWNIIFSLEISLNWYVFIKSVMNLIFFPWFLPSRNQSPKVNPQFLWISPLFFSQLHLWILINGATYSGSLAFPKMIVPYPIQLILPRTSFLLLTFYWNSFLSSSSHEFQESWTCLQLSQLKYDASLLWTPTTVGLYHWNGNFPHEN